MKEDAKEAREKAKAEQENLYSETREQRGELKKEDRGSRGDTGCDQHQRRWEGYIGWED